MQLQVFLPTSDNIKRFALSPQDFSKQVTFFFFFFFVNLLLVWVHTRRMKISRSVSWFCSVNINYAVKAVLGQS